jgi:hypothetical protein
MKVMKSSMDYTSESRQFVAYFSTQGFVKNMQQIVINQSLASCA